MWKVTLWQGLNNGSECSDKLMVHNTDLIPRVAYDFSRFTLERVADYTVSSVLPCTVGFNQ